MRRPFQQQILSGKPPDAIRTTSVWELTKEDFMTRERKSYGKGIIALLLITTFAFMGCPTSTGSSSDSDDIPVYDPEGLGGPSPSPSPENQMRKWRWKQRKHW
jgi:hypothetical protein